MAATVTATLLGTYTSRAAAVIFTADVNGQNGGISAGAHNITINHNLGVCPDLMTFALRSVIAQSMVSVLYGAMAPNFGAISWNASQAVFAPSGYAGAGAAVSPFLGVGDFYCQYVHSINR